MSTRYASLGTGLGRSPKTSVIQPWFRRAQFTYVSAATNNVTFPATAHTKSAWVQVIASTAANANYLQFLSGSVSLEATDTSTLLDIGVGAAGSEVVVVPDLAIGGWSSAITAMPVAIPSGARVSIRLQSARTTGTLSNNGILLLSSPDYALTPASVDVIGINTGTSAGTALSGASGAWTQITSSTAKDYQCVVIVPSTSSTNTANITATLNLGVGASGAEREIGSLGGRFNASESFISQPVAGVTGLPSICGPVPAGSRLAIKHNIASNPERYNVCLIGVPYV